MNKKQGLKKLHVSLNEVIQKWMDDNCESEEWESLNIWVGQETSFHMTNAAMTILESFSELQEYLRKEGHFDY